MSYRKTFAWRDLAAISFLLALVSAAFGDVLFAGRHFYIRDLTRFYYPTKRIIRDIILRGEFPLWNPYYSAGQPLAANPEYELFYPPQWLILLPNYDLGYRLHILVHVAIAAVGMYLLLRSMRLAISSSLFGGIIFGLGGIVLSNINLLPILFGAVWIPPILLFGRRFLIRPNGRDFALTALLMGLQLLTLEPTTAVQTWLLLGAYALYRAWRHPHRRLWRAALNSVYVGALVAAAGCVGAAQFLPALDHARDSARARPFDFSLVTAWSMPWARPLELVFPSIFGHIEKDGAMMYWGGGMYPGMGSPFFFSIYIGLLAIALVVGGAFARPRASRFVLMICGFSALLALGGHTPLFKWLYAAGLATAVRYPEKWSLMGIFTLIVFASMMFDRARKGDRKVIEGAIGFLLAIGLVGVALTAFTYSPWFARGMHELWGIKKGAFAATVAVSRTDWLLVAGRAAVFAGLLWGGLRFGRPRAWVAALLLAVLIDLVPLGFEVSPRMPKDFFTRPPVAASLPANTSDYRIFHEIDWYGKSAVASQYFSTGAGVYWVVRNGLYPMTTASWGFRTVLERDYDKTALLTTIDLVNAMWKVRDGNQQQWGEMFMAMSNATYRTRYRNFESEKKRINGNFRQSQPIDFVKYPDAPRYYFADRMIPIRNDKDFVDHLVKGNWSRRAAYVRGEAFTPAPGRVGAVREKSNAISLDVSAEGRSFLVLAVTAHKYWRATIDGAAVPIQTTNIGYQGVIVPEGAYRVVFIYRNPLVTAGCIISLLSLFLLGTAAAVSTTRRRRRVTALAVAESKDA